MKMLRDRQSKDKKGSPPAVCLVNPKYRHNVGASIRAASCFGVNQVWYSGSRIDIKDGERLPREERMKDYNKVELINEDYFLDRFADCTPIAIELRPGSEYLHEFDWSTAPNPVLLFGPEDGSIPRGYLRLCHRFIVIPSHHCVNLSAAVYLTLYSRFTQLNKENMPPIQDLLQEEREWTTNV